MARGWRKQWRGHESVAPLRQGWDLEATIGENLAKLWDCKSQSHKYTGLRRCVPTGARKTCPLSWSSAALQHPIQSTGMHARSCFWMCAGLAEHPTINRHRCTKPLLACSHDAHESEAAWNPRHSHESALAGTPKTVNESESAPKLVKSAALQKLVGQLMEVHTAMEVGLRIMTKSEAPAVPMDWCEVGGWVCASYKEEQPEELGRGRGGWMDGWIHPSIHPSQAHNLSLFHPMHELPGNGMGWQRAKDLSLFPASWVTLGKGMEFIRNDPGISDIL